MFIVPDIFTPFIKGREAAITANWNDRAKYNDVLQGILNNRRGMMDMDVAQAAHPGRMTIAGLQSDNAADLFHRYMTEQKGLWDHNAFLRLLQKNNPFGPNYSQENGRWVRSVAGTGAGAGTGQVSPAEAFANSAAPPAAAKKPGEVFYGATADPNAAPVPLGEYPDDLAVETFGKLFREMWKVPTNIATAPGHLAEWGKFLGDMFYNWRNPQASTPGINPNAAY